MIGIYTFVLALVLFTPAIAQTICPVTSATDIITIAGSTTVQPIADAWKATYIALCTGATVIVQGGGSSSGAQRVCGAAPSVDIGTMSRAWKTTEASVGTPSYTYNCAIGTMPTVTQIDVAIESVVVILKKSSLPDVCIAALGGLTFHQLRWIFSSYSRATLLATGWPASALANSDGNDNTHLYSELSASCPATEIKLVGPMSTSTSYSYFLETILTDYANGETFAISRPTGAGYFGTLSDTATINRVRYDLTGASIGYVYYNAYTAVTTTIRAVSLKKTTTGSFIAPTTSTNDSGLYPLCRRIYMNVLFPTVAKTKAFIEYGMSNWGTSDVILTGFYPIPGTSRTTMNARL